MTTATTTSSELASRYAAALIELAHDGSHMEIVERDLATLWNAAKISPEFAALLRLPSINRDLQAGVIEEFSAKARFHELTKSFLGVLIRNRRLYALMPVIQSIRDEMSRRRGEVTAHVQTAEAMTPAQMNALQDALSKSAGRKISVEAKVDPAIIGGMVVTMGSQMVDDSVRHKLERLKKAMGGTAK